MTKISLYIPVFFNASAHKHEHHHQMKWNISQLQAIVPPGGQSSSTPSTPSTTPGPVLSGSLTPQHQQQSQSMSFGVQQMGQQQAGMSGMGSGGASTSYAGTSGLSKSQQQQASAGSGGLSLSGMTSASGMPTAADFSLMLSLGLGLNPADASQLANLDLQKLAMYLVSMKWWDRKMGLLLLAIAEFLPFVSEIGESITLLFLLVHTFDLLWWRLFSLF